MREIKFRAWNKITNHFSDFVNEHKIEDINSNGSIIFMQYTGLKDKNGVEIYEGDIVKIGFPYTETNAKVIFNNGQFYPDSKCETIYFRYWAYESEVIGNIYENPELLN